MTSRTQRQKRTQETPHVFITRLAALRTMLEEDSAAAGDQALKLLEEYLESLALQAGYRGEGGLGRYVMFVRARNLAPDDVLERAESYTQIRNALAHTYGLQVSPALASELVAFLETLFKPHAATAAELMTRDVKILTANERLNRARDVMVRDGYGRLPVVDAQNHVSGLLTERDIMIALADNPARIEHLSVGEVHARDSAERMVFLPPTAERDAVFDALRQPHVVAVLITPNGSANQRPIGIITAADLLYHS